MGVGADPMLRPMQQLSIEVERETDGRWLAEVLGVPGVLAYGATSEEARKRALVLALRTLAERIEHGELSPEALLVTLGRP